MLTSHGEELDEGLLFGEDAASADDSGDDDTVSDEDHRVFGQHTRSGGTLVPQSHAPAAKSRGEFSFPSRSLRSRSLPGSEFSVPNSQWRLKYLQVLDNGSPTQHISCTPEVSSRRGTLPINIPAAFERPSGRSYVRGDGRKSPSLVWAIQDGDQRLSREKFVPPFDEELVKHRSFSLGVYPELKTEPVPL